MNDRSVKIKVLRFDPSQDAEPYHQEYEVPWEPGMSAMDALDHIYHNIDGSLAYYDHAACKLGICARCTGRIDGRPGLLCQAEVKSDMVLEPLSGRQVVRDLVVERAAKESE